MTFETPVKIQKHGQAPNPNARPAHELPLQTPGGTACRGPQNPGTAACRPSRFMVPMRDSGILEAAHEPRGRARRLCRAEPRRSPRAGAPGMALPYQRFMAPLRDSGILEAAHEPRSLQAPAFGQTFVAYATEVCTDWFMVSMRGQETVEAAHEPPPGAPVCNQLCSAWRLLGRLPNLD
jgi:hypothetical protein